MSNHSVFVLESENYSKKAIEIYNTLANVEFYDEKTGFPSSSNAQILVIRLKHFIGKQILDGFPKVSVIISPTTGLNHIDVKLCEHKQLKIISLKGESTFLQQIPATAEFTFGLILALLRNINTASFSVKKENMWNRDLFKGHDLYGKTLGIVGYGRIGKKVATYAKAFGMNVIVCDPYIKRDDIVLSGCSPVLLQELFAIADIITLHVNYNEDNQKMVSKDLLLRMKKTSFFINTSRGEIVDEDALADVLEKKLIAGAAVDVLTNETEKGTLFTSRLMLMAKNRNNIIITPHLGGCSFESMEATEIFCAQKAVDYLKTIDSVKGKTA